LWDVTSDRLLGHHSDGPSLQGIANEANPIVRFPRHCDEQVSARHLTGVVLHTAHDLRRQTRDPASNAAVLELLECHALARFRGHAASGKPPL
jgi:hypothetical protein